MKWTVQKDNTARMLAEGGHSMAYISSQVNTCVETIRNWKRIPEFQQRIDQFREQISDAETKAAIEKSLARTKARNSLLERIEAIAYSFTDEELSVLRKNPISTINLMLRLQTLFLPNDKRRTNDIEDEDDDFPFPNGVPASINDRFVELLREGQQEEAKGENPGAHLL